MHFPLLALAFFQLCLADNHLTTHRDIDKAVPCREIYIELTVGDDNE